MTFFNISKNVGTLLLINIKQPWLKIFSRSNSNRKDFLLWARILSVVVIFKEWVP